MTGIRTTLRSRVLLKHPWLNKGTAFTREERSALGLEGLLPPAVETIDQQLVRVRAEYDTKQSDLGRHIFLRQLQDENRTLFYRFVVDNVDELLPVVYTPTVGLACQQFSRIYRRPQGLFVSWPDRHRLPQMLEDVEIGDLSLVVVTDGERILGLGDQGVGGMGIPIGKLALYSACAGLHPARTLPVMLDVGTNNRTLLDDPLYLGWRHERIVGDEYHDFVAAFVDALVERHPGAVLQWEDFAQHHATALLEAHRDRICSFNDDIQGTAAVALAAVARASQLAGRALSDERVLIVGAGSAGCGVGEHLVRALIDTGLSETAARRRVTVFDRRGAVHDRLDDVASFQRPLAQPWAVVREWGDVTDLAEVVRASRATVLIGTSGVGGLFGEDVVRAMRGATDRPIVLPLSNPTSCVEATPADLSRWTDGRALVATGSPFAGTAQANNVFAFPGLGLGAVASGARTITGGMLTAAARAVADASPPGRLLPEVADIGAVSRSVAVAVARRAIAEGAADLPADRAEAVVDRQIWSPVYEPVVPA